MTFRGTAVHILLALVIMILAGEYAYAHCRTAFAPQRSSVATSYSQNYTSGSRASVHSVRSRISEQAGQPLPIVPAPDMYAYRDAVVRSFPPQTQDQARLIFEAEYLAAVLNTGDYVTVEKHVGQLVQEGVLDDKPITSISTDPGDTFGELNPSVLKAFIRVLLYHASLSKMTEFDQQYIDGLTRLVSLNAISIDQITAPPFQQALLRATLSRNLFGSLSSHLPDIQSSAFELARAFAVSHGDAARWERINAVAEFEEVLALDTETSNERVDLYLQADGVRILQFSTSDDGSSQPPAVLSGLQCHDNYLDWHRIIANQREGEDFILASVILNEEGDYAILLSQSFGFLDSGWGPSDHFFISQEDVLAMSEGGLADVGTDLAKFMRYLQQNDKALVFTAHPLMQSQGEQLDAAQLLTHSLQRAYPSNDVYIDAPAEQLAQFVTLLRSAVVAPEELAVVLDVGDFGVDLQELFFEAAEEWSSVLGTDNIVFYSKDMPEAPDSLRGVIVITGRTNEELREFVRDLGEKGYLENKFVVLESCGEPLSVGLVAEINERYQAAATFHYRSHIDATYAHEHAQSVIEQVSGGSSDIPFGRTVTDEFKGLLPTVRRRTEGFWTICELDFEVVHYG